MKFISDITVNLEQVLATDMQVLHSARVSTKGIEVLATYDEQVVQDLADQKDLPGLIKYLMQHRHGTPFEHNLFTFFVHAPIFVWREWHRHRIGFSYNEESARYKQLEPVFYIPPIDRPMFKVEDWKPGKPKFLTVEEEQQRLGTTPLHIDSALGKYEQLVDNLTESYKLAYVSYECNLNMGFDPGLARDCLPVGIYSSCWVTCNARSLMAFLSLRTHDPLSRDISYPLYEIEVAARKVEDHFAQAMPITYQAFLRYGRRAP
jgi:thymidylate synthase (FAD)